MTTSDIVNQQILKALDGHKEALEFLELSGHYYDLVDDVVDEEKKDERIRHLTIASSAMYNCIYWKKWGHLLTLLERIIINTYFDSVKWSKEQEEWKRQHAKVYSHAGMMMIFAVILIELGDEKLNQMSLTIRHCAYDMHKDDKI